MADLKKKSTDPWAPQYVLETHEGRVQWAQDCKAFQLLQAGECPPHLQQRALEFLVYVLCGTENLEFRPDDPDGRKSAFASGMRHVGQQVKFMLKVNTKALLNRPASEQG